MIREKAYAKINLTLDITGKREDGFHGLDSIMAVIDVCDDLTFEKNDELIYDSEIVNENEICLRIFNIFKEKFNISNVKITNKKRIPVSAGLAGGSSDAASTVRGLNQLFDLNLSLKEEEDICNMVGSDVSFCLNQTIARCVGRGEIVNKLDIKFNEIPLLIIKPNFSISTKEVYKNYNKDFANKNKDLKRDNVIKALKENDINLLKENIFNDLTLASEIANPLLKPFMDEASQFFNCPIYLSGSGPTIYLFDFDENLVKKYQELHKNYTVLITKIIPCVKN